MGVDGGSLFQYLGHILRFWAHRRKLHFGRPRQLWQRKTQSKGERGLKDNPPSPSCPSGTSATVWWRPPTAAYLKILEIEPINFALRSSEEQFNIISSFASWLKISPIRLQCKAITRRADSDKHVALVKQELAREENPQCRALGEDYLRLIQDVGSREALTRRFFLIFQYEAVGRDDGDYSKIYGALQGAEQTARAYFLQCGNGIVQPANPDEATAEILYQIFNRRSCQTEPFQTRVDRVVLDTMASQGLTLGLDPVPEIPVVEFLAPRGIDFTHYNHIIMDGRYYSILYIRGNGYPSRVRAGWMSALINAGEGIDIDIHLRREDRSTCNRQGGTAHPSQPHQAQGDAGHQHRLRGAGRSHPGGVFHQERHRQLQRGSVLLECFRHCVRPNL